MTRLHSITLMVLIIGFTSSLLSTANAQVENRQPLPFKIENTTQFPDDQIYVAIVGEDLSAVPGKHIWVDCKTGQQHPMDRSLNTVPGPVYVWLGDPNEGGIPARNEEEGNRNPDGTAKYASCFTKLSEIPNKTVMLQPIQGCRVFISAGEQLYLFFHGASGEFSGYTGPSSTDPTDPNQGILHEMIELTYNKWGYFANTTRVDSYKYPIGMEVWGDDTTFVNAHLPRPELTNPSNIKEVGKYWKVGEHRTHQEIVDAFKAFAPTEFQGCLDEETGEIKAPSKTLAFADGTIGTMPIPGPYVNYLESYIDAIWTKYASEDLYFDAGDAGLWKGRVYGNRMELTSMSSEGGPFYGRTGIINGKPTTQEVLEGKGLLDNAVSDRVVDLMIQAQLCAAINRHVVDVTTPNVGLQDWSNPATYYQQAPANFYSKFWHQESISIGGRSYGFCYDDVWDQSSSCPTMHPTQVVVTFGGYANEQNDVTPPTVPTSLQAAPAQTSVSLSWNASTDDIAMKGYLVYKDGNYIGETTTTSYQVSALTENTNYTFEVAAKDMAGNVSAKASVNTTTLTCSDSQSPSAVSNIVVNTGTDVASVTWNAATDNVGVASYEVSLGGTVIASISSTSYNLTALSASTNYTLSIVAIDACGNRSAVTTKSFTTLDIAGCSGSCTGTTGTKFDWEASSDQNNPTITFIPKEGIGNGICILHYTVDNSSTENVLVTMNSPYQITATVGQTVNFYYTYAASAGGEDNSLQDKASFVVGNCGAPCSDFEKPSQVSNLNADVQSTSVKLIWGASTDNVGVTGYSVYKGSELIGSTSNLEFNVASLSPATTYTFKVLASDACDNISDETSITTTTDAGSACSGTEIGITGTEFQWLVSEKVSGAEITFIPGNGVGTGTCILHYAVNNGAQQNVLVTMNEPYVTTAQSGDQIVFYYTYARAAGGEDNNLNTPISITLGGCSSVAKKNQGGNNLYMDQIRFYPNPVQNELNIQMPSDIQFQKLVIFDVSGKKQYIQSLKNNKNLKVDLSFLISGTYFIVLQNQSETVKSQFIKN